MPSSLLLSSVCGTPGGGSTDGSGVRKVGVSINGVDVHPGEGVDDPAKGVVGPPRGGVYLRKVDPPPPRRARHPPEGRRAPQGHRHIPQALGPRRGARGRTQGRGGAAAGAGARAHTPGGGGGEKGVHTAGRACSGRTYSCAAQLHARGTHDTRARHVHDAPRHRLRPLPPAPLAPSPLSSPAEASSYSSSSARQGTHRKVRGVAPPLVREARAVSHQ